MNRRSTPARPGRGASRRRRSERGSVMIEVLMASTVLIGSFSGYMALNVSVQHAQRSHQTIDIAAQGAQGVIEKLQATPWGRVGIYSSDTPPATYDGKPSVVLAGQRPAAAVARTTTETLEGTQVVMTTWVTWGAPSPAPASASAYGTKIITVRAQFTGLDGVEHTRFFRSDRTAAPSEALIPGVPVVTP